MNTLRITNTEMKKPIISLCIWTCIFLFYFLGQVKLGSHYALWNALMVVISQLILFYSNRTLQKKQNILGIHYRVFSGVLLFILVVTSMGIEHLTGSNQHYELGSTGYEWYTFFSFTIFFTFYLSAIFVSEQIETKIALSEKQIQFSNLKREHSESQLQLLRSKIDPHFLFNSMNAIYTMSYLHDERTPEKIMLLSDMLRYVLYDCDKEFVDLKTEIDYLKGYIDLHDLRTKNTQNIDFKIEEEFEGYEIAPMILLPFVENAYKHSHIVRDNFGFIFITLRVENNKLFFKVENSIYSPEKKKNLTFTSHGIGMKNVKSRLKLQYPKKHTLEIDEFKNRYTIQLSINLKEQHPINLDKKKTVSA